MLKRWTEEEDDLLKECYGKVDVKEIAEVLDRTEIAIRSRASHLSVANKLRAWTEGEDRFLKQEYGKMKIKEIAEILGRTKEAINSHIRVLKLKPSLQHIQDSDTHKTCRICLQALPKTNEFFSKASKNKDGLYSYCKKCKTMKTKESKILKEIRAKAQAKEDWKRSIVNQRFICKVCNQEKLGKEMSTKPLARYVSQTCKKCDSERRKEHGLKAIEKIDFSLGRNKQC
jgi:hypothetical protein